MTVIQKIFIMPF